MILLSAPLNARSVTLIVLSFRSFHKPFDKTLSGMCSNGCGVVLCVYTVIHMFNCGTVTYGVKAFEGISQENNGAFPLHGTVRFGTAQFGSVAFPP